MDQDLRVLGFCFCFSIGKYSYELGEDILFIWMCRIWGLG